MCDSPGGACNFEQTCDNNCKVPFDGVPKCERGGAPGACCCGKQECCTDFCYVQPERAIPIKPSPGIERPTAMAECETVYRRSYYDFDPCTAAAARSGPVKYEDSMPKSTDKMDTNTIQKLSYLGHCGIERQTIMKPHESSVMKAVGPMQSVTTQKHDYVPKPLCPVKGVTPITSIKFEGAIENNTVNRLSYMPVDICCNPPRKAIKPVNGHEPPSGPPENCTVYKLSYMPVCAPSEPLQINKPQREEPPPYVAGIGTVYKYSYLPVCCPDRTMPIKHDAALRLFDGPMEKDTIYRNSYFGSTADRTRPIKPEGMIPVPEGPMEKCTVYKLSYLPNINVCRTQPIVNPPSTQRSDAPMQSVTTQKHDFVPKPICKRGLIIRPANIARPDAPPESCTINRLSYMPVDFNCFARTQAIKPSSDFQQPSGPFEPYTTQKLSYLPVCLPPKEPLPWANKATYNRPTAPAECCTIQKLSYMPPGRFMKGCCGACKAKSQQGGTGCYPKAGIVK